ncbi:MAG: L,D-transpeptidase family protein [Candidatus Brennerbacteria bacterium]|nr:L,D-transpeptidase family protein [Candidatus Brennerbacteria bacterium]
MINKVAVLALLGFLSLTGGALLRSFLSPTESAQTTVLAVSPEEPPEAIIYEQTETKYFNSFLDSSVSAADEDKNSFLNFKNHFIKDDVSFVEAGLRQMRITLYRDGEAVGQFPILSKGREGSWWETPSGKYAVLSKEVNHFSSIGKVWMPWSVQFYGNFFIHGWPYYSDGTPVAKTYSGGCIRLSSEDAREVFNFVDEDTPVLVLDEPALVKNPNHSLLENSEKDIASPDVYAKAVFIADLDSGLVILDKNAAEPLPVASLTKLMTAVTASELIYLERYAKVLPEPLAGSLIDSLWSSPYFSPFLSSVSLVVGKSYTAFDLLYPLLMQSSNQSASVIASFIGKSNFVEQMNKKADSLGMQFTTFADPSGKDDGNVSTLKDLAKLSKYILEKRKFLFDITKGENYLVFGPTNFGGLSNYNDFYGEPALVGVKNGETRAAGQTLVTVWNFKTPDGENRNIFVGVLGSADRKSDAENLLGWLETNFGLGYNN